MVVWAQVKSIDAVAIVREGYEEGGALAQFLERGFVPVEIHVGTRESGDGADRFECCIYSLSDTREVGTGDGRAAWFVDEITMESINATLAEIEQEINKIWGNNWHEVAARVSWFAIWEFDYVFEAKEPVVNPDGTINYDPSAYRSNSFMAQGIEAAKKGLN